MSTLAKKNDSNVKTRVRGALARAAKQAMSQEHAENLLRDARIWHALGFLDEQREACELVLASLPEQYEALHLLGFHAQLQGDYEKAERYYAQALAIKPDFPFSRLAYAQLRMQRTGFREGRELYEARFDAVTEATGPDWRGLPIARWRGETLENKKIYLWAEQGLGDIIMFSGFLSYIKAMKPARVVVGMFPNLVSLFARSFPGMEVESIDAAGTHALAPVALETYPAMKTLAQSGTLPFPLEPLKEAYQSAVQRGLFDYAAPLGDLMVHGLPHYVPADMPSYLVADPKAVAEVRERLAAGGRQVGISWFTTNARETTRNIPLQDWLPLLKTPGCQFVALQHSVSAQDWLDYGKANNVCTVAYPGLEAGGDAELFAAVTAAMDEVITIDNSTAHFAGALGVPITLLLPKGHNFRWPERQGAETYWYAKMHAVRQKTLFDWQDAIAETAAALQRRVDGQKN